MPDSREMIPAVPDGGRRIVYLAPENDAEDWGPRMRFRLTYSGALKASGRDPESGQRDKMAEHKQAIRKAFHKQLRELWRTSRFLAEHRVFSRRLHVTPGAAGNLAGRAFWGRADSGLPVPLVDYVASNFQSNGYRFVPLVCSEFSLLCNLDILFLRHDHSAGSDEGRRSR